MGYEVLVSADRANRPDYTFTKPRVAQSWMDKLEKDVRQLFSVNVYHGEKTKKLPDSNCVILIARNMFYTIVPVFQLNVMDLYLADSPSRRKLWKKGISAYNYYSNAVRTALKEELIAKRDELMNNRK